MNTAQPTTMKAGYDPLLLRQPGTLQSFAADPAANSFTVHGSGVQLNVTWRSLLIVGAVIAGAVWYLNRKK